MAFTLLTSCVSRKQTIYLQDMEEAVEYPVVLNYEAKIQRDDKLNIVVGTKNPELAMAFSMPGHAGYTVSESGDVTQGSLPHGTKEPVYFVDSNGDIDFPILGRLHVAGLTRSQLVDLIRSRLVAEGQLKEPNVFVDFLDFKYTVLGEVGGNGTFKIEGNRITVLEAIAKGGGVRNTGRMDRVAVIRDTGGSRRIYHLDLRSKDVFMSPAYYLCQNDIVYVEPNGRLAEEETRRRLSYITYGVSGLSTIVTFVMFILK